MAKTEQVSNLHLTRGTLLARNIVWNLLGLIGPVAIGIFSVPRIIRGLGTDRFGILTLAWALIGYFNFFDLGLGRALTKLVAEKLGEPEEKETSPLFWTSLVLMLGLGIGGAILLTILSPWLVNSLLHIPVAIRKETLHAFYLLSAGLPIVITTAGLRGFLEAHQRFGVVSGIRAFMGAFMFIAPLAVLPFSVDLSAVVAVLVLGRLVVWLLHLVFCFRTAPQLLNGLAYRKDVAKALIGFGAWMTVSNLIGPLLMYLDRFLIGIMISVAAVAYYATPYEMVTKLLLIPGAFAGVLFPAFSLRFNQDRPATLAIMVRGTKYIYVALFPLVLVLVAFAHEGLTVWLGAAFAANSSRVLQWLSAGVLLSGLAQLPFAQIQGAGRPDLTAKLHLIELPCYLLGLWWLIERYGISGAALAWVIRVALDASLLFVLSGRLLPGGNLLAVRTALASLGASIALAVAALTPSLTIRIIFCSGILLAFTFSAWHLILTPAEKAYVWNRGKQLPAAG